MSPSYSETSRHGSPGNTTKYLSHSTTFLVTTVARITHESHPALRVLFYPEEGCSSSAME
jgi:hypothetical protein